MSNICFEQTLGKWNNFYENTCFLFVMLATMSIHLREIRLLVVWLYIVSDLKMAPHQTLIAINPPKSKNVNECIFKRFERQTFGIAVS